MSSDRPRSADTATGRLTLLQRREAAAREAVAYLSRVDPDMGALIRQIGVYRPIITRDPFQALVGSIIHQQVSMAAAATILKRVHAACGPGRLTAARLASVPVESLRAAGVSSQKARYLHDLAAHFADGRLTPRKLRSWDDQRVLEEVTKVLGIGRWTAEMLLIFCLERPDVWPVDDLGVQKAAARFAGRKTPFTRQALEKYGERWRPFRTYATWYLWRSLEGPLMPGIQVKR
jgi:DNA-3-methyladenine glycosylase II